VEGFLKTLGKERLDLVLNNFNIKTSSALNFECGADFVKMKQAAPKSGVDLGDGVRACSLDGDADRIVFYYAQGVNFF
jgi:phosphoacetylglucosamine mutase